MKLHEMNNSIRTYSTNLERDIIEKIAGKGVADYLTKTYDIGAKALSAIAVAGLVLAPVSALAEEVRNKVKFAVSGFYDSIKSDTELEKGYGIITLTEDGETFTITRKEGIITVTSNGETEIVEEPGLGTGPNFTTNENADFETERNLAGGKIGVELERKGIIRNLSLYGIFAKSDADYIQKSPEQNLDVVYSGNGTAYGVELNGKFFPFKKPIFFSVALQYLKGSDDVTGSKTFFTGEFTEKYSGNIDWDEKKAKLGIGAEFGRIRVSAGPQWTSYKEKFDLSGTVGRVLDPTSDIGDVDINFKLKDEFSREKEMAGWAQVEFDLGKRVNLVLKGAAGKGYSNIGAQIGVRF